MISCKFQSGVGKACWLAGKRFFSRIAREMMQEGLSVRYWSVLAHRVQVG